VFADKLGAAMKLIDDPSACAVFLDFDGTLIDIAAAPDLVRIPSDLVPLLARLSSGLRGALAIVTGRPVSDINRFLHPLRLVTAGLHGAQLRTQVDGEVVLTVGSMDPDIVLAVGRLRELAPGVVIESKISSIAVHYRLAPSVEPQIKTALKAIVAGSPDHFILCPGRCVIEVMPRHVCKGAAVDTLMALPAFKGRCPIMVGDDVPDEPALAAAVRHGGLGLRVSGEHFKGQAFFEGPASVRAWLAAMADQLEAKHGPLLMPGLCAKPKYGGDANVAEAGTHAALMSSALHRASPATEILPPGSAAGLGSSFVNHDGPARDLDMRHRA
jgi:trehalose 6-phosphate phosphatase